MDRPPAGFSMPRAASLYPEPPYRFVGAEQVSVCFTADADRVRRLLPPGLEPAADPVPCEVRVCWYPWSVFGPFHESYVLVQARDEQDSRYWYLPLIFTDNEAPLAAGRELWGYPKKLALMTWDWGGNGATSDELLRFTAQRPADAPLFTVTFAPERLADPAGRHGLPVVSHRYLPPAQAGLPPAADELIAVAYSKTLQRDATGSPKLWAGRGSFSIGHRSETDPWYLLEPREVTGAFWQVSDFDLPAGTVLRDYLRDPVQPSDV